jgi:hypothetical protein
MPLVTKGNLETPVDNHLLFLGTCNPSVTMNFPLSRSLALKKDQRCSVRSLASPIRLPLISLVRRKSDT